MSSNYKTLASSALDKLSEQTGVKSKQTRLRSQYGIKSTKEGGLESNDFEDYLAPVAVASLQSRRNYSYSGRALVRWVINIVIGVTTGLIALLIIYSSRALTNAKLNLVFSYFSPEYSVAVPFLVMLSVSLSYILIASVPVLFIEPLSVSSGIPEVKAILNGIRVPRVLRLKTILCKIFGVIFSVSTSAPLGLEGPMFHIGSGVGSGLSQGKSVTFGLRTKFLVLSDLRSHKERREFALCGSSAGIAAAFNAPIGGVLFTMEESAIWYRPWRAFVTSMIAAYTIDFMLSGLSSGSWGSLTAAGMFSFGSFSDMNAYQWSIFEIPIFILIGVTCGIFGAIYNAFVIRLSKFRAEYITPSKTRRILDMLLVITLVTTFSFFGSYLFGKCKDTPLNGGSLKSESANFKSNFTSLQSNAEFTLVSFYCPEGQYNDLASISLAPSEEAIRMLFHISDPNAFELWNLLGFSLLYIFFQALSSGLAVPSGIFIPSILAGSAFGRLVGQLVVYLFPQWNLDSGTYALIGGAAFVGGITRMTISLTVILLECTGNYMFGLPIMLSLMSAKFVGNWFNDGIYDLQIQAKKWPMLEEQLPKQLQFSLRACDVMTPKPLVLREIESVGRVLDMLLHCTHNGFPVVFSGTVVAAHSRLGSLSGYIQRRHLAVLLASKAFHRSLPLHPWEVSHAINRKHNIAGGTPLPAVEIEGGGDEEISVEQRIQEGDRYASGSKRNSRTYRRRLIGEDEHANSDVESDPVTTLNLDLNLYPNPSIHHNNPSFHNRFGSAGTSISNPQSTGTFSMTSTPSLIPSLVPETKVGKKGELELDSIRLGLFHEPSDLEEALLPTNTNPDSVLNSTDSTEEDTVGIPVGSVTEVFFEGATSSIGRALGRLALSRRGGSGLDKGNEVEMEKIFERQQVQLLLPSVTENHTFAEDMSLLQSPVQEASEVYTQTREGKVRSSVPIISSVFKGYQMLDSQVNEDKTTSSNSYHDDENVISHQSSGSTASTPLLPREKNPNRLFHYDATNENALAGSALDEYRRMYGAAYTYSSEPLLDWGAFQNDFPRFPDVSQLQLTEEERGMFVDLRPYMDGSPITVHVHAPLNRVFRLLKGLGLRHLIVVNDCHDVVGIITRKDIEEVRLMNLLKEKEALELASNNKKMMFNYDI